MNYEKETVIIKIALCDDDDRQLVQIQALLREYSAQHPGADLTVRAFSSGAALLEHVRTRGIFDVYLLDIIMPGENGIELGLGIRALDRGGQIIYITTSPEFALDSYQVNAADYVLKPFNIDTLSQTLEKAMNRFGQEHQSYITVKTREGLRRLPVCSIMFSELVGRCVQYHLSDGALVESTSVRGSFQSAIKPLMEYRRFVLCATSFLVNLSFVEMIETTGLRLTDGRIIPLSRSLRADVTGRWMDYCLEGENRL